MLPQAFRLAIRSPGIAIALVLSLLISLSAFLIWQEYIRTSDRTRRTTLLILDANELMTDLHEAQSSARGYLLSRDPALLAHFQRASASAQSHSDLLLRANTSFDGQRPIFSELESRVQEELKQLRFSVESQATTIAAVQADEALMNSIRALNSQVQTSLQQSLAATRDKSRFLARLSEWITTLGCVGIFMIVLFSQIRIQHLGASRLRLNEELTAANEDLGQFLYSASHDLQEPLRVLTLYSDLIERNLNAQRPVTEEIGHLRRAARHMSALLFDLLSYTEVVSGPRYPNPSADLAEEARNAIKNLNAIVRETGAEIKVESLPVVCMESAHAQLLLENLIGNSLKYHKQGQRPHIKLSAEKLKNKWLISVADDGIGIAPTYHQQIFGIFKRLHTRSAYPGTGLGLAICKKIVERYGGTIWVESEVGLGSTFQFLVSEASGS